MELKTSILLIEDDKTIYRFIENTLEKTNYKVIGAFDGKAGLLAFTSNNPDVLVLDLGLPDMDGVDIIRKVREISDLPIIVVSARTEFQDKVDALDAGADDYLTKPFSVDEFLARIRVAERRISRKKSTQNPTKNILENGNLTINLDSQNAKIFDKEIGLTPNEYKLLVYMCQNLDRVLSYRSIIKEVWGYGYDNIESLRVFIASIRKKIEKADTSQKYIQTHIGVGYMMLQCKKS